MGGGEGEVAKEVNDGVVVVCWKSGVVVPWRRIQVSTFGKCVTGWVTELSVQLMNYPGAYLVGREA